MSTTIEQLEIQVQQNSTSAVSGIDALSASLTRLKTATKGGVGLTSVANQLRNLNTALSSLDASSGDKIDKLSASLEKLKGLGTFKISSSIGSQIRNIGSAATSLNTVDFTGIEKLATAMATLNTIGKASGLQSAITQLRKIPELATALNGVDWNAFTSQIQRMSAALAPLASQLNAISAAFTRLPANIRGVVTATNSLTQSNNRASKSYVNLWAKCRMAMNAIRTGARIIAGWINESNQYIENVNLFTVAMGEYADEARAYAEQVAEALGIDPSDWIRNQGVFNTIIRGFGVAGEKAQLMSKNLTQLGYDISSFYNISVEDAMTKLSSGIAGELEPLRRLGYDLSVARLQQEAYTLGIKKSVNQMTQAEKSQLRYYAIMTQVTDAHGDMARTLDAPANQLRILQAQLTQCARALGNVFIPALNAVLPYVIAVTKVIRILADTIAKLVGFSYPEIDYSGLDSGSTAVGDLTDELEDATEEAKKLKKTIMGFDELNLLNGLDGLGDSFDIPLPEYDFLTDSINSRVDDIVQKMKEWLGLTDDIDSWADLLNTRFGDILTTVAAIGTTLLAWKVAKGLLNLFEVLSRLKGSNLMYTIGFTIAGLGLFLDAWKTMKEAIGDILANGANFTNVTKLISGFAEGLGAAFLLFGNIKLAGAALIVSGIAGIVSDISDMVKNDVNWENAMSLVKNIGLFIAGIGLAFGSLKLSGIGLMISGVALIVENFKGLVTGISTGDWSGVDKIELITGGLLLIGGLVLALKKVATISAAADIGKAKTAIDTVTTTTAGVNTSVGQLNPKLTSLAKNLGMGLIIVAEVAAGAALITGAIILLGMELEQVGIAWNPVIENGKNVAIAMGIGVGILAAFGAVTALLGSVGTTLIVNLALGIAMLALIGVSAGLFIVEIWAIGKGLDEIGKAWEPVIQNGKDIAIAIGVGTGLLVLIGAATAGLGVATVATAGLLPLAIALGTAILLEMGVAVGLFIVEVWAIGKGLDEIGKAWQPVLDNGETIAKAIGLGTALLVGIGVVTAALGVATVASVGLLPLAIALGTAILVELAAAFVLFTESLIAVANELGNRLSPALRNLNGKLPTLSSDMKDFVRFMTEFAGYVTAYTKVSVISGLAATIDTIIGWFTKDPIKKLAEDVEKVYEQFSGLNEKLKLAVPELKTAYSLLTDYNTFMTRIEKLTNSNVKLSGGMFVNMKEVGENLVMGLVAGIESKASSFRNAAKQLVKGFESELGIHSPSTVFQSIGTNIVAGLSNGMSGISSTFNSVFSTVSSWIGKFGKNMYSWGSDMMSNMVSGINSGLSSLASKVASAANTIRSYLHFSQPDVGPLADFNSWMPDMMSQLAGGIADNEAQVQKQIEKLASDMSLESSIQANVSAYGARPATSTGGDTDSGLVSAIYNAVSSAIGGQNNDEESGTPIIINLGNEQIASFLVKQNKRVALISGGKA